MKGDGRPFKPKKLSVPFIYPLQAEEALGPISIPRGIEMGPRASSA